MINTYDLSEFTKIRTVYSEKEERGGYAVAEYEYTEIKLCQREGEYYLLYMHDPLPGGCGDIRCEGIVHITDAEAAMDDRQLKNLYYRTQKKHLIDTGLHQAEMTLTYLSAAQCADRTCIVWCASLDHQDRYAGCIECTKDEVLTDKKLRSVLHKAAPKGTVIPSFRLYGQ